MIRLRSAKPSDQQMLEAWDKEPHVIACDPSEGLDWAYELPRELQWRELLIAEHDDFPFGFIQIIDPKEEETHYWGEIGANLRAIDIWIGPKNYLNKGFGTIIMKMALERCFGPSNVEAVIIDPLLTNTSAIRFYKRLGFWEEEIQDFDGDKCQIMRISREEWTPSESDPQT